MGDGQCASLRLHLGDEVAPVSRRIFGSFLEHMGRCVYTGIFEPGHPAADVDGFRQDVLQLVRDLGVTMVRYPGGNFVSGYRWEDGIGPVDLRPTRLNLAWHSTETNAFGLGEFMGWTRQAGVEPMLAVNLGTRGIEQALDLVEYCNHPAGTALSDLRAAHGHVEPYGVRVWCLGNEMDGSWQLGHRTPAEYARLATETARAMRQFDPGLELVACGSSGRAMPTFGVWEETVLTESYELVDLVSAHAYYELQDDDLGSFLASAVDLEAFVTDVAAIADRVGNRLGSSHRIDISLDEWNVWYLSRHMAAPRPTDWPQAPRLSEDDFTVADAVVVGSLLVTILRHVDRVTAACLAQLVNTIGAIRTEPGGPAWRQSIYHPFAQAAALARGVVLRGDLTSAMVTTRRYGEVPAVDAVATWSPAGSGTDDDEEDGSGGDGWLTVFAVNRHPEVAQRLDVELGGLVEVRLDRATVIADPDWRAVNTRDDPDRVVPRPHPGVVVDERGMHATLPPVSWNVLRVRGRTAG
jgi:alpha-N-arabinofuranosidase